MKYLGIFLDFFEKKKFRMIWIDEKRKVNESNFLYKNHTFIHRDSDSCYFVHWLSTVCSNDNWI